MKRDFSKSDLKNGMIVETQKGTLLLVMNNTLINNDNWVSLGHYYENLTRYEWMKDNYRDIVKIYTTNEKQCLGDMFKNKKLIWERFNRKKITLEEIEEQLGYKVEIIDENNATY